MPQVTQPRLRLFRTLAVLFWKTPGQKLKNVLGILPARPPLQPSKACGPEPAGEKTDKVQVWLVICNCHFKDTGSFSNAHMITSLPLLEFSMALSGFQTKCNSQRGHRFPPDPAPVLLANLSSSASQPNS